MIINYFAIWIFILVPGSYTPWSNWKTCSATCGGGTKERSRTCTNPSPQHGGANCKDQNLGAAAQRTACNKDPCPGIISLIMVFDLTLSSLPLGNIGVGLQGAFWC